MANIFRIQKLNNIADAGLEQLPRSRYEIASEFQGPDAILLRSFNMHDMDIASSVLAIARAGAGVNNIPVGEMTARGVPVFNAPGANANAVKELVLAGMLIAARNLLAASEYTRGLELTGKELAKAVEAGKKQFVGYELPRRRLGVIGLGAIGVKVANAAYDLGMDVTGYDPSITVTSAWQLSSGVKKAVSIDDLLSRSDMVTIHVPSNDKTRGLINAERLGLMPDRSVLLNFSRGDVVYTPAVSDALAAGKLATYVTDFPDAKLIPNPQVISLPHLGASTAEAEENCAVMVARQLREYLENGNVTNSVNFPETVLARTRDHRLAIPHKNIPNMVAQILSTLAAENNNIADLVNHSRDTVSHTIVDLDAPVSDEAVAKIQAIDGILSVRVLPIYND